MAPPYCTEYTLIIIKPDFLDACNPILQLFLSNGFRIIGRKRVAFSPEQAAEFYKELEKCDPCFPLKVMALSKGPAEAVILNKSNAILDLLKLMTYPTCCALLNSGLEYKLHASMSVEHAVNEIRYIFPNVILEPNKDVRFGAMCGRNKLTGFLAEGIFDACAEKAENVNLFMHKWLLEHKMMEDDDWCGY